MMDFERRLKALESLVRGLIRTGKVAVVDPGGVRVRVTFPDRENVQSGWLKVMVENTQRNKDFWMPDIGEDVVCLMLPNGQEEGFVLGGYYVDGVTPPAASMDLRVTEFADGGRVEYNRATGQALVKATTAVTIDAPDTTVTGTLTVQQLLTYQQGISGTAGSGGNSISGNLSITGGDVTADNIGLKGHGHIENDVGGRTSNAVP